MSIVYGYFLWTLIFLPSYLWYYRFHILVLILLCFHLQQFDASTSSSFTTDAMHPFNKENLALSSSVQPELSKSTHLQMLVILLINRLLAFIPIEQDLELWNSFEGSLAFRDVMTKYEKGPYVCNTHWRSSIFQLYKLQHNPFNIRS